MKKKFFSIVLCGMIAFLINFSSVQAQSVRLAEVTVPQYVNALQVGVQKCYTAHLMKELPLIHQAEWNQSFGQYCSFIYRNVKSTKADGFILYNIDNQNYITSLEIVAMKHSSKYEEMLANIAVISLFVLGMDQNEAYNLVVNASDDSSSIYVKSLNRYIDVQYVKGDAIAAIISAHR